MPTSPGSCWCKFGLEADMRESIFFKWLLQIVNLLIFSQRDSIRNRTGMEIDATQQHKCRQNCLKYGQNDTKHCGVYMLFCIADFGGRSRGGGNEADWHRDRGQVHTPVPAQLARLWPQLEAVPALNLKDQVQLELEVASVTRTASQARAAVRGPLRRACEIRVSQSVRVNKVLQGLPELSVCNSGVCCC